MRNCKTLNEFEYGNKKYYLVMSKSGKYYYFKQIGEDIKVISSKEFNKNLNESKRIKSSLKTKLAKKIAIPALISSIAMSSLSGCGKTENEDITIETNEDYSNDNDLQENTFLKLEDLTNMGYKLEKVVDESKTMYGASVYNLTSYDFSKTSNNPYKLLKNKYNNTYDVPLDANVTWDDCIELINKKNIDENYKEIFRNAINGYKELGLNNGLPILYDNIKNTDFIVDLSIASAYFDSYDHKLVIGNINIKKDKNLYNQLVLAKDKGIFSENEFNDILEQEKYILTHEFGHMLSSYYNEKTGDDLSHIDYYALVDPYNEDVLGIVQLGKFLSEGFADYMVYETNKMKPNRALGYPINQCLYITIKEMLDLDINELIKIDTIKLTNKLKEFGIIEPFDHVSLFESSTEIDYSLMDGNLEQQKIDFTFYLDLLFYDYYCAQLNKGIKEEEIQKKLNNIIEIIKKRVQITSKGQDLYAEGSAGLTYINLCYLKNHIDNLWCDENTKQKIK